MQSIGLIGCGAWGVHILRDLLELGTAVHVVGRSAATRELALERGASSTVATVAALPEVDGIVISTPTSIHAASIREAGVRRVPMFVEKPMTIDPTSADELAAEFGDRLFVMDKWRYHGGVERLAELAKGNELGAIVGLELTRIGWGNPHGDVDGVWILAPHDWSIALEILGTVPQPTAAVADVVDGFVYGMRVLATPNDSSPWVSINVSTRSPSRQRAVRLLCERGVAELTDAYASGIVVHPGTAPSETTLSEPHHLTFDDTMPLRRELEAFVDYLRGGDPPRSSAAEGAAIVHAVQRARVLAGIDSAAIRVR